MAAPLLGAGAVDGDNADRSPECHLVWGLFR